MQQKRQFETQRISRWKLLDRLGLAIPVLILVSIFVRNGGFGAYFGDAIAEGNIAAAIAIAVVMLLISCIISIPLMLIWRVITRYLRKQAIKNATYYASAGIDYYREKLSGLSPAMISMLVDLEVEPTKDATACILKYAQMGVVSLKGDQITVVNPSHPELTQADHILLKAVGEKVLDRNALANWAACTTEETLQTGRSQGYFKEENTAARSTGRGCGIGCLSGIVLLLLSVGASMVLIDLDAIGVYLDAAPADLVTPYQQIQYLMSGPNMSFQLLILLFLGIALFVSFALPVVGLVRSVVVSARPASRVERTPQGDERAEQIAGMKNFIHDFSNLSQAEKGALVVWDDFLVYAVVLEENEAIVKEILEMSGINKSTISQVVTP